MQELLSWIEDEDDLILWSGNTFENAFTANLPPSFGKETLIHLLINHKNELFAYGEIVRTKPKIATICRVIVHPEKRGMGITGT